MVCNGRNREFSVSMSELREACLTALGRIGTAPAAEAIRAFAVKAPESLRPLVVDAQLDVVEMQVAVVLCVLEPNREELTWRSLSPW